MNPIETSFTDPFPIAQLTLKVTLLLLAFFVFWMLAKKKSASFRHRVLVAALCSLPCLCVAEFAMPSFQLPWLERQAVKKFENALSYSSQPNPENALPSWVENAAVDGGAVEQELYSEPESVSGIVCETSETVASNGSTHAQPRRAFGLSIRSVLLGCWLLGVTILAVRFLIAWVIVSISVRRSSLMPTEDLNPELRSLIERGRKSGIDFREHRTEGQMPLCFGVVHSAVLLPKEFRGWKLKEQKSVVLHEIAHAERRDCLINVLAHLQNVVFWFHPLSWMLHRLLKSESEMACDDWVISRGVDSVNYASALFDVTMSTRRKPTVAIVSVSMADSSPLERRMRSILSPTVQRTPISKLGKFSIAMMAIAMISVLSAFHLGAAVIQTAKASNSSVMHLIELNDESVAKGVLTGTLEVQTAFGNARIDFDKIRSLKPTDDSRHEILANDGTVVQGVIQGSKLPLLRSKIETSIEVSQIKKVTTISNTKLVAGKIKKGFLRDGISYNVRAPSGYDPAKEYPAVVFFHDADSSTDAMIEKFVVDSPRLARRMILIGINGENKSEAKDTAFNYTYIDFTGRSDKFNGFPGTDRQSPALVTESITELRDQIPISSVYVVGEGDGAFLAFSVLMNYPEMIDGVVAVNGGLLVQCVPNAYENESIIAEQKDTPVWVMYASPSKGSFSNSYTSAAYSALKVAGFPKLKLTTKESFDELPVERAITWFEKK